MAGDDFGKVLNNKLEDDQKVRDDFDDISSIYTAN